MQAKRNKNDYFAFSRTFFVTWFQLGFRVNDNVLDHGNGSTGPLNLDIVI